MLFDAIILERDIVLQLEGRDFGIFRLAPRMAQETVTAGDSITWRETVWTILIRAPDVL